MTDRRTDTEKDLLTQERMKEGKTILCEGGGGDIKIVQSGKLEAPITVSYHKLIAKNLVKFH